MTKRDKVVLFCAGLLAVFVMAGAFLAWMGMTERSTGMAVLFGFTVVVGTGFVWGVYLIRVNIDRDKGVALLGEAYREVYRIIRDAVKKSRLPACTRREIREEVLDLLLSAQEDGQRVEIAVGVPEDYAADIIRSFARPLRREVLDLLDGGVAFALMVLGSGLLAWLEQRDRPFSEVGIDLSLLVFFGLVSFLLIPVTRRLIFRGNPWLYLVPLASGVLFVLAAELLRALWYDVGAVRFFLDGQVGVFRYAAVPWLLLCAVPLLIGLKALIRRRRVRNWPGS